MTSLAAASRAGKVALVTGGSRGIGEPADTAAVVAFLAPEEAGFITGQVI